ncbi:endothelin-converting enzyme-like 1 [Asbolus verrucosus]|uniref:Endothelin-converting enzyme-like 1 n=1 Tax=Asbolus verrucosus TaxID=1661398 RepID=A0A482VMJ6_ASBVE|nr:endothelin-converting enzyme-like 1 [Asbolus verrucosus]
MSTTDRIQTRNVNIQEKEEFVCRSVACNATASIILSQMNHSATPCEDFYEFACGGVHQVWKESAEESNAEMLSMQLSDVNDLSPKYLKDFKNFHDSCLEYEDDFNYRERIHGVEQLLETIGKFQLGTETHPSLDLTELVAKLILRQSMPLFDIGIDVDKQSSNLILQLTLPQKSTLRAGLENWSGLLLHKERCLKIQNSQTNGLYLNITGIYDSYQKCQDDFAYYLNSVENVLLELEVFANLQSNQAQLVKEIKDIRFTIEYDVLDSLSLLPRTETFRHFIQKKYDVRKISDLQIQYPVLQWKKLFETLTGHEVETNTLVQVYVGKYFNDMLTSLAKASPLKLNNALLAIHAHDLFINTVLSKEKSNRNLFCFDLSKKLLPDVWAYLVKSVTINEQKYQNVRVTNLFTKLKHNFCNSFQNEAWMDESTKISLISKCRNLSLILFSSVEEATLTKRYQTLNLTGNYQINLIHLLLHYRQTIYSIEGTTISPATVFSYFLDPLSNEPLVVYASNAIAVPVGLMHKASADLPNYVSMARIGFEIARQITRHFDPVGIKYKIHLSPSSKQAYLDFVQSYDDVKSLFSSRILQHKNISFHLTESTSANEMIVDNAAFKLAYDSVESYKSETNDKLLLWLSSTYSREEIFFIAVAQEFCKKTTVLDFMLQVFESRYLPPVLRVENIMGNSEEFTKTFDCAIGSGMNQFEEKLIVKFPYLIKADDENNENDDSFAEDK